MSNWANIDPEELPEPLRFPGQTELMALPPAFDLEGNPILHTRRILEHSRHMGEIADGLSVLALRWMWRKVCACRNLAFYVILSGLAAYAGWINGSVAGFEQAVSELRRDSSPLLQQRLALLDARCSGPRKERNE